MRCAATPVTSRPRKLTRPPSTGRRPVTQLKSVVLPEPLGPIRLTSSPAPTDRSTASTAVTPRKRLVSPRTSRSGMSLPRGGAAAQESADALGPADHDDEEQHAVDHHA